MGHCRTWALVLLLAYCATAVAAEPGATSPRVVKPLPPAAKASRPAAAHGSDRPTLEKAVAGVVVGALAAQFDGRPIEARFGAISDEPGENGRRSVSGEGQMRFAGEAVWIDFKFRTQYDGLLGQASTPELELGAGGGARPVPNDTAIVRRLDDHLVDTLQRELGSRTVRLQLDRIESVETGQDYLLIDAWGLADFGIDGSSPIRIAAFYDRRTGQWLQLDYDMTTPPQAALPPVAGR